MIEPQRPSHVSPYAQACLEAVAASGLGACVSLGGAFGLAHYHEYRTTHDVDAWWVEPISDKDRRAIVQALEEALRPFGQVRTRAWGEVVSVELIQGNKARFSFQIAQRSAKLQPAITGLWPGGVRLDSLPDLIASKMSALVERGAPRDLRDIYTLCRVGMVTVAQCWRLWEERQRLAEEDADHRRAVTAILGHLARLEQTRPLDSIEDPKQKMEAGKLRTWFAGEFVSDVSN
jgi:predicted nucleotidyltransferase